MIYEPVKLSESSMRRALLWIVSEGTGASSKTIWGMMMNGFPPPYNCTPSDNSDFGRCYRLLKLIPEFEKNLERMRSIKRKYTVNGGPEHGGWIEKDTWSIFVDNYDILCELYVEGVKTGIGTRFYNFWKEIVKTER